MRVLILSLLVIWLPVMAHAAPPLPERGYRAIPEAERAACNHYVNRARFKSRQEAVGLEVILADGCAEAMNDLYVRIHTNPFAKRRAELFLERVVALKSTIITINMDRIFGAGYGRRSTPLAPTNASTQRRAMGGVTRFGEYLIAREMGVIDAFRAWAGAVKFQSARLQ